MLQNSYFTMLLLQRSLRRFLRNVYQGLLAVLILLPLSANATQDDIPSDIPLTEQVRVGLHGMLLFGSEYGLFASNLPMFHSPHNAQIVLQLTFDDPQINTAVINGLTLSAASGYPIWTIVPQQFDLSTLSPTHPSHIEHLSVDIVKGHFEHEGKVQWKNQGVTINKILLFNELDTQFEQQKTRYNTYLKVNNTPNDKVQFLVKRLTTRPDADHIVRLDNVGNTLPEQIIIPIDAASLFNDEAKLRATLPDTAAKKTSLPSSTKRKNTASLTTISRVYLEVDELK
ncbi:hypothetical protein [Shewanella livingstonensis]|uniref:Uncharacterized protein n=1 Tax=Shewanella livingstonensis TaxID=150120 RepID=A0A3G8LPL2_9GAMM|nr:hypothetical protein [Shewanella livingstonensis]AZG71327.1 hypothetical protein EGC82_00220 [Shewanella livingstonensis]